MTEKHYAQPEAVSGARTARMVEMLSLGSDSSAAEPNLAAEQLLKNLPREVLDRLVLLHNGDKPGGRTSDLVPAQRAAIAGGSDGLPHVSSLRIRVASALHRQSAQAVRTAHGAWLAAGPWAAGQLWYSATRAGDSVRLSAYSTTSGILGGAGRSPIEGTLVRLLHIAVECFQVEAEFAQILGAELAHLQFDRDQAA